MSTACLLTVLTCGSPAVSLTTNSAITVVVNTSLPLQLQRSRTELRTSYRLLRKAAVHNRPDPFTLTPQLIGLYVELSDPHSLPYGERKAKFLALRKHLRKMHNKLVPVANQGGGKSLRRRGARPVASAAGGAATRARANQLIRLIQSTICPESWDVNGGENSIQFYAPLNVLVVRASAEVHGQIGGTLPNLKP